MSIGEIIALVIGIFGVLLMLLAWASLYPGQDWDLVASGVAGTVVLIVFFGIVVAAIWTLVNRR